MQGITEDAWSFRHIRASSVLEIKIIPFDEFLPVKTKPPVGGSIPWAVSFRGECNYHFKHLIKLSMNLN